MGDATINLRNCPEDQYYVSLDTSLRIDRRSEPRPDIAGIIPDHNATSPIPVEDAILAIDVISPDSTFRDLYDKVRLYGRAGVERYWVVDPQHDDITLTEFALSETGELVPSTHTSEVFTTERPWKATIDLPALTDRWKAKVARDVRSRG